MDRFQHDINREPTLSRVASSIYWMQRYVERAENVARFVLVNYYLSLDMPGWVGSQWEPLVLTTGDQDFFKKNYKKATESSVLKFLLLDERYPNSIISCLRLAKENARSIQEKITSEVYEYINEIVDQIERFSAVHYTMDELEILLSDIKRFSHYLQGSMDSTFTHDESWQFRNLGAFLERADKTTRILDVKYFYLFPSVHDVNTTLDNIPWFSLLNSTSALEMYIRRYGLIDREKVIEFLILDPNFSRSVLFCIDRTFDSLKRIQGFSHRRYSSDSEKLVGALQGELKYRDIDYILDYGIHQYLDHLQLSFNKIGEAIKKDFFD